MTPGQLAALIAAGFFALLVIVTCFVLLRVARLLTAATAAVTGYRERADTLIEQAQSVVDRTNEQLARTDAITASMDEVTANMAELSGHVSAMTGVARALTGAVGAPVTGISAVAYGVRRAVALRRPGAVAAIGGASREGRQRRPERMAEGLRGAPAPRSGGPGVIPPDNTGDRK